LDKFVIFDLDGTLLDSAVACTNAVNSTREMLNLEPNLTVEFVVKVINDPNSNSLKELFLREEIDESLYQIFIREFMANYEKYAVLYDGVRELLAELKRRNYKIALASNSPEFALEKILNFTQISHFFDCFYGASSQIPAKPDPKMLNLIAQNASKCVFLGDSWKDKLAAQNAQIPYIHVTWGFGSEIEGQICAQNPNAALLEIIKILD